MFISASSLKIPHNSGRGSREREREREWEEGEADIKILDSVNLSPHSTTGILVIQLYNEIFLICFSL